MTNYGIEEEWVVEVRFATFAKAPTFVILSESLTVRRLLELWYQL